MDIITLKKSFNYFFSTMYKNKSSSNILDPFSCVVIFALLYLEEDNCKLSIHNNKITIQRPLITQGFIRWTMNDNRNDIYQLCNPIEKALEWYLGTDKDIINIFNYAIKGVEKLIKCYNNEKLDTAVHSLIYYKSIMKNNLGDLSESMTLNTNNDSLKKFNIFKDMWCKEDIVAINILLSLADKSKSNKKEYMYYLNSIYSILDGKDLMKNKIINNIIDF